MRCNCGHSKDALLKRKLESASQYSVHVLIIKARSFFLKENKNGRCCNQEVKKYTYSFVPNCNNNSYSHADVVVEMINKDMHLQAKHIILAFQLQNAFPVESTLAHIMEKLCKTLNI